MGFSKPLVLTIMDGWGHNPDPANNAVAMARTPTFDRLWAENPHTYIRTDGPYVGLPSGQMGNSEVGHLNIGSGRIVQMDITRIDEMAQSEAFDRNPALAAIWERSRNGGALHLMGLLSDGGVHSQASHLYALLEAAKRQHVKNVFVHAFTDGRDTPPQSGVGHVVQLLAFMERLGCGRLATVCGRYYAMDRDRRWERTERAMRALLDGRGHRTQDPVAGLKASYAAGVTDEFIEPIVVTDAAGVPVGRIGSRQAAVFFNFRADRARQLTSALNDPQLGGISRAGLPADLVFVTMTRYEKDYPYDVVLEPQFPDRILGEVCADLGWRNLRVAETEKYPHVTYFFNGGREEPYDGEERELVPSPKVATYDLQPEMSAAGVCDAVVRGIESGSFEVIVVNFANGDMVGHTGVIEAAVRACETVDGCLDRIERALKIRGGHWIVTADHGNADLMVDPETGAPHTYHTTFPVPLILMGDYRGRLSEGGSLRDISPTILGCLGAGQPAEMTGRNLCRGG
ncbi:MAG: 2,3-bisphosphoglycerate-independent phosphoglycerate mutase [Bryobacterales bacterium]|nr:2,3-bisphosphoglycerate-independent phosphoglycerate mutase [Bryobacterales bacterium]